MNAESTVRGIQTLEGALQVITMLQLTGHLWPRQAEVKAIPAYDFIIVGAGSAGCVIANRLTENKSVQVLLIEAGSDPPMESVLPGLLLFLMKTNFDWNYNSEDEPYVCHRNPYAELGLGKLLGGTSSVNFMIYGRGNPRDYKRWATAANDTTWLWKNVLPYFIKSEKLEDPGLLQTSEVAFHGTKGLLGIARQPDYREFEKYLSIFKELGNKIVLDVSGNRSTGYSHGLFTIANETRQNSAYAYLRPIKNRPNLHLLKNTLVTKIIFDSKKNAIGVKVLLGNTSPLIIKAKREVIVSAGAIKSPQLLMLSGIGPRKHLRSKDIKVIADLPVGKNFQDHVAVVLVHTLGKPLKPPNRFDPHRFTAASIVGYAALNKSKKYPDYMTISYITGTIKYLLQYSSFSFGFSNKVSDLLYNASLGKNIIFTLVAGLNRVSRGKILLRSKNPNDSPKVYLGYYTKESDMINQVKYVADVSRMVNTTYFKSVKGIFVDATCPHCAHLESGSKKFWKCYSLCMMVSLGHYSGTCAMGTVVDGRLRVHGVKRLRVADASIMPVLTSASTYVPTVMIGEKAADFIKEDCRL